MKNIIKNQSGSALIWVLVICVIFGILGMAIGAIALSMNNRSINNNIKQQTYFSARSAVDAIFEQLNGDDTDESNDNLPYYLKQHLLKKKPNNHIEFNDFYRDVPEEYRNQFGTCDVTGDYDDETGIVTLKATAKKGNQEDTVILTARKKEEIIQGNWPGKEGALQLVGKDEKVIDEKLGQDKKMTVYCATKDNTKDNHKGGEIEIKDNAGPVFIYVESHVTLRLEEIDVEDNDKGKCDVYFYLEPEAKLVLKGDKENDSDDYEDCNIYIYGPNATLEIYGGNDEHGVDKQFITINGGVSVGEIFPDSNHVTIIEKKPADSTYQDIVNRINGTGTGGSTSIREIWEKIEYKTNE
ncbi:hypothetical protein [Eubacterium maltosivorans]|uniref:Uncharacterized protein n=1 Tax=Eubacterium maltosivorans TaxID=2041044 RepID=A0A4P9C8K6_EUBML|nr:hypothetical protein [Eubacterium maltosivorans]QCT71823.1 hypothetical protein CPZ25_010950 [Eubacterium maltosivorans]